MGIIISFTDGHKHHFKSLQVSSCWKYDPKLSTCFSLKIPYQHFFFFSIFSAYTYLNSPMGTPKERKSPTWSHSSSGAQRTPHMCWCHQIQHKTHQPLWLLLMNVMQLKCTNKREGSEILNMLLCSFFLKNVTPKDFLFSGIFLPGHLKYPKTWRISRSQSAVLGSSMWPSS